MNALATIPAPSAIERALIQGDLTQLRPEERLSYYKAVCESVGLNPLTKPFEYITLNGKLTLYAKRDATDQLRKIHCVSVTKLEKERIDDVYVVTAYVKDKDGREDSSTGAVTIGTLKGDALANCLMKAETKAKRRATLSICGLGLLDETEVSTIPGAVIPTMDELQAGGNEYDQKRPELLAKVEEIQTQSMKSVTVSKAWPTTIQGDILKCYVLSVLESDADFGSKKIEIRYIGLTGAETGVSCFAKGEFLANLRYSEHKNATFKLTHKTTKGKTYTNIEKVINVEPLEEKEPGTDG